MVDVVPMSFGEQVERENKGKHLASTRTIICGQDFVEALMLCKNQLSLRIKGRVEGVEVPKSCDKHNMKLKQKLL